MTILPIPITTQYCRNWTNVDALREIMANAIDSQDDVVSAYWKDGVGYIYNSQSELERSNLTIGGTSKADDEGTIGTFGEGLKVGAMVLLRENAWIRVASGASVWKFFMDYSEEFDSRIMFVDIQEATEPHSGTMVRVGDIDEDDFIASKDLFIRFGASIPEPIAENKYGSLHSKGDNVSGYIAVKGVKIYDGSGDRGPLLHTWNLKDIELNRDRNLIDSYDIQKNMELIMESVEDKDSAVQFLRTWLMPNDVYEGMDEGPLDGPIDLYPSGEARGAFADAVEDLYGDLDGLAIQTGPLAASAAKTSGHRVLNPHSSARTFLTRIGIKKDFQVLADEGEFVLSNDLSESEQHLVTRAKEVADAIIGTTGDYELKVFDYGAKEIKFTPEERFDSFIRGESHIVMGSYNTENDVIYIRRELCKIDQWKNLLFTYIHELTHRESGARDCTNQFENALLQPLVDLLSVVSLKGVLY